MDDVDFRESTLLCNRAFGYADEQGSRTRMGYDRRHKRDSTMLDCSRAAPGYAARTA
ncbi:hypothetical protein D3C87_1164730 [compost metagenome]